MIRTALLLSLALGALVTPAAEAARDAANGCVEYFRNEPSPVTGYAPSIEAIRLDAGHTIKDPAAFARDNLGEEVLEAAKDGRTKFYLYMGDGKDAYARALRDGWHFSEPVAKNEGFHQIFRAERNGESAYILLRVNGEDRKLHIQSLFKLAGVDGKRVVTVGRTKKWRAHYLQAFRRTGEKPDLVFYGFAMSGVAAILDKNPVSNWREYATLGLHRLRRDVKPNLAVVSDLDGIQMHRVKFKNGFVAWFFNNLYGDLSDDLLEALVDYGVPRIAYGGTAGALDSKFRVGDIVLPTTWREGGKIEFANRKWDHASWLNAKAATYQRVAAPAEETLPWLEENSRAGVDVVEVELGYWLKRLEKARGVDFTPFLIVSDVMSGANHADLTEWAKSNSKLSRGAVVKMFEYHLRMRTDREFAVSSYKKINLGDGR